MRPCVKTPRLWGVKGQQLPYCPLLPLYHRSGSGPNVGQQSPGIDAECPGSMDMFQYGIKGTFDR